MTLEELKATLDSFSPAKMAFVSRMVESLAQPSRVRVATRHTWLTSEAEWIEHFGLALSVHHAATNVPLGRSSFEAVFRNACEHVQWTVDPPGSPTRRFVDMTVDTKSGAPRRLSLKSTAAKNLSLTTAHVSKLTEAAWIQDARRASDRKHHTLQLFQEYRRAVGAIVMLRAFRDGDNETPRRYQLLEVPVSIFSSIQHAPLSEFRNDAPVIPCRAADGTLLARVALDRSDAKVTVRSIRLASCILHAEWIRP